MELLCSQGVFRGVKWHSFPKDEATLKEFKRLIRNDNFKKYSANTRICRNHFLGGERLSRTELPSIFSWTVLSRKRREIIKDDLPVKRKKSKNANVIIFYE